MRWDDSPTGMVATSAPIEITQVWAMGWGTTSVPTGVVPFSAASRPPAAVSPSATGTGSAAPSR
jgi:hypothetical protein